MSRPSGKSKREQAPRPPLLSLNRVADSRVPPPAFSASLRVSRPSHSTGPGSPLGRGLPIFSPRPRGPNISNQTGKLLRRSLRLEDEVWVAGAGGQCGSEEPRADARPNGSARGPSGTGGAGKNRLSSWVRQIPSALTEARPALPPLMRPGANSTTRDRRPTRQQQPRAELTCFRGWAQPPLLSPPSAVTFPWRSHVTPLAPLAPDGGPGTPPWIPFPACRQRPPCAFEAADLRASRQASVQRRRRPRGGDRRSPAGPEADQVSVA